LRIRQNFLLGNQPPLRRSNHIATPHARRFYASRVTALGMLLAMASAAPASAEVIRETTTHVFCIDLDPRSSCLTDTTTTSTNTSQSGVVQTRYVTSVDLRSVGSSCNITGHDDLSGFVVSNPNGNGLDVDHLVELSDMTYDCGAHRET
jgi:hypothetical protein